MLSSCWCYRIALHVNPSVFLMYWAPGRSLHVTAPYCFCIYLDDISLFGGRRRPESQGHIFYFPLKRSRLKKIPKLKNLVATFFFFSCQIKYTRLINVVIKKTYCAHISSLLIASYSCKGMYTWDGNAAYFAAENPQHLHIGADLLWIF